MRVEAEERLADNIAAEVVFSLLVADVQEARLTGEWCDMLAFHRQLSYVARVWGFRPSDAGAWVRYAAGDDDTLGSSADVEGESLRDAA